MTQNHMSNTDSFIEVSSGEPSVTGKTRIMSVFAKDDPIPKCPLGVIKWFGRWRCYAFFPSPGTVFERRCLRDIATFCERVTQEHRHRQRPRKETH